MLLNVTILYIPLLLIHYTNMKYTTCTRIKYSLILTEKGPLYLSLRTTFTMDQTGFGYKKNNYLLHVKIYWLFITIFHCGTCIINITAIVQWIYTLTLKLEARVQSPACTSWVYQIQCRFNLIIKGYTINKSSHKEGLRLIGGRS